MRIARFQDPAGRIRYGLDLGDQTANLLPDRPLGSVPPWASEDPAALKPTGEIVPIHRRLAPVVPPSIFCIGLNYREHAKETGAELPRQPVIFMKAVSSLNDPGAPIRIPACCTQGDEVDYECELAVVIGKPGRDIPESRAFEHVAGYTAANDVSARRWQKHGGGGQWIRGKSFDTFCPLGPVLVTPGSTPGNAPDEIADPHALALSTTVDGQVLQQHTTADMIFSIPQIIAFLSQDTTLLAGTVILTGTPQGVGVARKPPIFLQPGNNVVVEIEKIGQLANPVV